MQSTESPAAPAVSERRLMLHPKVAIRPEPFGALAYHYGNRRLVFLKHPDMVTVVQSLADHDSLERAFDAVGIGAARRPAFERAIEGLIESQIVIEGDRP